MLLQVNTSRLTLLPFTKLICEETMNKSTAILNSLGIRSCEGWPDLELLEALPRIIINLEKVKEPSGFETWMIIERKTNLIIGDVGFKGLPTKAGEIDLGYGIVANKRRKGFAHEAAAGIVKWAFDQKNIKVITASCLSDNLGSKKTLSLLNFTKIEEFNGMIFWTLCKTT